MAGNYLSITQGLARKHEDWKKSFPYSIDYLTLFFDDFKKYERQRDSKSLLQRLLDATNAFIKAVTGNVQSYCDISEYLRCITTQQERINCICGLGLFLDFGGIVKIGYKEFNNFNSLCKQNNAMVKEIMNKTKHIK